MIIIKILTLNFKQMDNSKMRMNLNIPQRLWNVVYQLLTLYRESIINQNRLSKTVSSRWFLFILKCSLKCQKKDFDSTNNGFSTPFMTFDDIRNEFVFIVKTNPSFGKFLLWMKLKNLLMIMQIYHLGSIAFLTLKIKMIL